jgi:hypothetical protein
MAFAINFFFAGAEVFPNGRNFIAVNRHVSGKPGAACAIDNSTVLDQ